jgi:16S rRNA (guanine1207-N2)-methyltransferase
MSAGRSPYYRTRSFSASLADQTIQIISKPGMPDWDRVSPAQQLLAEAAEPAASARALLLGCGHGALGVALARQAHNGVVVMLDSSWIALTMAGHTLQANGVANASVCTGISVPPAQAGTFDIATIAVPADRRLTRRWLAEAHAALRVRGQLLIAGANDHGIRSAIADAEALFGNASVLAYKQGNRVARAHKTAGRAPEPLWGGAAGIAPGTWYEFDAQARGYTFRLRSLPGVFAYDRIDEGTALLLEALAIPAGARVLDAGCGYGIIGLVAARMGAAQVDMVDVNIFAVAAAEENIGRNGVANAHAFPNDGVPEGAARHYDVVATNPPFHVGKAIEYDVTHAFVERAPGALKPGGRLFLVANQFIRYDQLLRSAFERVECVAATKSYRVWSATQLPVV